MEENIHGQWLKVRLHCRQSNSLSEIIPLDAISGGGGDSSSTATATTTPTTMTLLDDGPPSSQTSTISRAESVALKSILKNRTLDGEVRRRPGRGTQEGPRSLELEPNFQKVRFLSPRSSTHENTGFYNEQQRLSSKSRASSSSTPDLTLIFKAGASCDKTVTSKPEEEPASNPNKIQDKFYDVYEYIMEKEDKRIMPIIWLPAAVIVFIVILWSYSIFPTRCGLYSIAVVIWFTYLKAWNTVVEETLLVITSLGIQIQQTNILGKLRYAKFVPVENVKSVIINEIIRRHRVIAYLLIILDSTESTGKIMVPMLIGTLPRLRTVERIYHQIQRAIF